MNTNILQTLVTAMQRRLAALPQRLRPFTTEFDELPKNLMLTGARGCGIQSCRKEVMSFQMPDTI